MESNARASSGSQAVGAVLVLGVDWAGGVTPARAHPAAFSPDDEDRWIE